MYGEFFEWLDGEIVCADKSAAAFCVSVCRDGRGYAASLIGSASFDDEDDDWVRDTLYTSREDGDEFAFSAENAKKALEYIRAALKEYLKLGSHAKRLKGCKAVAFGAAGGELHLLYRR